MTRARASVPWLVLALALAAAARPVPASAQTPSASATPSPSASPATSPTPRGLFERAAQIPEAGPGAHAEPEAFEFERGGYRYRVAAHGAGRRTQAGAGEQAARPRLFNLRLAGGDRITHLYFAEHDGNILLACEVSDAETGAGLVVRLEQPSMRALWRAELPAFNLGPPLRDGGHLYLTALGFAAKLELEAGTFLWRHGSLYGRAGEGTFNRFGPPELDGPAVVFREADVAGRAPKSLRVHRRTGKILGIE